MSEVSHSPSTTHEITDQEMIKHVIWIGIGVFSFAALLATIVSSLN